METRDLQADLRAIRAGELFEKPQKSEFLLFCREFGRDFFEFRRFSQLFPQFLALLPQTLAKSPSPAPKTREISTFPGIFRAQKRDFREIFERSAEFVEKNLDFVVELLRFMATSLHEDAETRESLGKMQRNADNVAQLSLSSKKREGFAVENAKETPQNAQIREIIRLFQVNVQHCRVFVHEI